MPVVYLNIDQIDQYHSEAIKRFGGADGLRSSHLLASAVYQPQQSAFGEDAYQTIPEKAAAYGYFIAENQAFVEGNKRTASISMLAFLDLNGFEFHQTDDEIAEMFEDLGAGIIEQGEFFGWVINHAKAI